MTVPRSWKHGVIADINDLQDIASISTDHMCEESAFS